METKIRYLVDTNVWLERLLEQGKSDIAAKFFDLIPTTELFVSDFSIHSIAIILTRLKKFGVLKKFINDLFVNGQIEQLTLDTIDLLDVINNIQSYGLDFDDSYQFSIAQKYDLTIATFDEDFDIKGIKKNTPDEIVEKL